MGKEEWIHYIKRLVQNKRNINDYSRSIIIYIE